jgi:hypothetical protein
MGGERGGGGHGGWARELIVRDGIGVERLRRGLRHDAVAREGTSPSRTALVDGATLVA